MTVRRFSIHVPQLVNRLSTPVKSDDPEVMVRRLIGELDAAMSELQRFLRYLQDGNDSAQVGAGIEGVTDGVVTSITTNVTAVSSNYFVTDADGLILVNAVSGAVTITLPSPVGREGKTFTIKKVDATGNAVIVQSSGGATVDGESQQSLIVEDEAIPVTSTGSRWVVW